MQFQQSQHKVKGKDISGIIQEETIREENAWVEWIYKKGNACVKWICKKQKKLLKQMLVDGFTRKEADSSRIFDATPTAKTQHTKEENVLVSVYSL